MTEKRIELLRKNLENDEAVIITSEANRLYFTAFPSSDGYVLITKKSALFFIDSRYIEKAKADAKGTEVILLSNIYNQLNEALSEEKIKTVYFETETLSLAAFEIMKEKLCGFNLSTDNKIQNEITRQRSIKTSDELSLIKEAQRFTDETFSYILGRIEEGRSEKEIMLDMEFFMRKLGSEGVSFEFIVVSGKNSSLPHGVPTDKKIEKGDFLTMDFGAVYKGYRSDMTRTVALGFVTDEQRKVYETVKKAQEAAIDFIKPNVKCCEADKIARDIIKNAGYGEFFGHGLGHSLGIEIHEMPACNPRCTEIMKEGLIMTVEPGIYLENKFGVRIEDMVIVNKNGCENLTKSPKELIIL